jgi:hypothetical protein
MTGYFKEGGVYTPASQIWVKQQGVWLQINDGYVKDAGQYKSFHHFDSTPPDPPVITLQRIETNAGGRYIKVGARASGAGHDSNLKRIRILTTYNGKAPTTQFGGTYTSASDADWPDEPWSEWRYNGFGSGKSHSDSSVETYKQWTRNPNSETNLKEGRYYFSGWAEDFSGNWSAGNHTFIDMPKRSVDAANYIKKELRIRANGSGSWTGGQMVSGQLEQRYSSPSSRGFYFYGHDITNNIGSQGTPTIKSAQIYLYRGEDNGKPSANVYLFRHDEPSISGLVTQPARSEVTKIGTIAKGEGKWFDIPEAYWPNLEADDIKGFGLENKDPVKASGFPEDYSVIKSIGELPRSGEVNLVWTEKP